MNKNVKQATEKIISKYNGWNNLHWVDGKSPGYPGP